jgi:hypothetical protein
VNSTLALLCQVLPISLMMRKTVRLALESSDCSLTRWFNDLFTIFVTFRSIVMIIRNRLTEFVLLQEKTNRRNAIGPVICLVDQQCQSVLRLIVGSWWSSTL